MIFAAIPLFFFELFLSLKIATTIGFGWSAFGVTVTMLAGSLLLRFSPYAFMGSMASVQLGKMDLRSAHNASMAYLAGSILLIIPGVLSDSAGLLALIYVIYLRLFAKIIPTKRDHNKGDSDVIDVEIID